MIVRELRRDDVVGVQALRLHRYREIETDPAYGMGTLASPPTPEQFAVWFHALYRSVGGGTGVCAIAEEDGRIVGMARIGLESEALETRHVGVLSIEVLPDFRGRGIGTALLGRALEDCRGRFEIVKLEVLPENAAGQRLYRKLGFVEHGRLPRGFQRGGAYHDFVLMHRVVSPPESG